MQQRTFIAALIAFGTLIVCFSTAHAFSVFQSGQVGNAPASGRLLQTNGSSSTWVDFGTTTANSWSALQQFNGNASTTQISSSNSAYFATGGGSVGIGTTSPASLLSVAGDVYSTTGFGAGTNAIGNNALSGTLNVNGAAGILITNFQGGTAAAAQAFFQSSSGVGIRMGSVGSGYSTAVIPGVTASTAYIQTNVANLRFITSASSGSIQFYGLGTAPSEMARFSTTGNFGVGTTSPWGQLSASSTSAYPTLAIEQKGSGAAATFLGGKVGVGTTTPAATFTVDGTAPNFGLYASTNSRSMIFNPNLGTIETGALSLSLNNLSTGKVLLGVGGGSVGIGLTGPTHALDVTGNQTTSGYLNVGSNSSPNNTTAGDLTATRLAVGNGSLAGVRIATFSGTVTDISSTISAVNIAPTYAPTADNTGQLRALNSNPVYTGAFNFTLGYGSIYTNDFRATGNVSNSLIAFAGTGATLNGNANNFGTIANAIGASGQGVLSFGNTSTGTVTNAIGFKALDSIAGTATITNDIGFQALTPAVGGTRNIGLLIGAVNASGNYGIYDNSGYQSYFGGNVGIGTTSPSSLLQLYSTGTTTLSVDSNSATKGSCLELKDSDGSGYTYVSANNGVLTASTISCK